MAKLAARKQAIEFLQKRHSDLVRKKTQEKRQQNELKKSKEQKKPSNQHVPKTNPFEEDLGVSTNPFDEDMGHSVSSDDGNPFLADIRAEVSTPESQNETGTINYWLLKRCVHRRLQLQ